VGEASPLPQHFYRRRFTACALATCAIDRHSDRFVLPVIGGDRELTFQRDLSRKFSDSEFRFRKELIINRRSTIDKAKHLSNGHVVLTIAFLLLIFGIVGRWDYEEALATELATAQATARMLMCEERTDSSTHGRSQANLGIVSVADHRFTEQAEKFFVLTCIVVTD
jgi:hypothetical protein